MTNKNKPQKQLSSPSIQDLDEFPTLQSQSSNSNMGSSKKNTKKVKDLEQQLESYKEKYDSLENEVLKLRVENEELKSRESSQSSLNSLETTNSTNEKSQEYQLLEERYNTLKIENSDNKRLLSELQQKCESFQIENYRLSEKFNENGIQLQKYLEIENELNNKLQNSNDQIQELNKALSNKDLELREQIALAQQIDEKHTKERKKLVDTHQAEVSHLNTLIRDLQSSLDEFRTKFESDMNELSKSRNEAEENKSKIDHLKFQYENSISQLQKEKEKLKKDLENKLTDSDKEISSLKKSKANVENELVQLKSSQSVLSQSTSSESSTGASGPTETLKQGPSITNHLLFAFGGLGAGIVFTKLFLSKK